MSKVKLEYDKLFIIIASILGLVYMFMSPLFTGSDEHTHFFRAYAITEGYLKAPIIDGKVGGLLPESLSLTFSNNNMIMSNMNKNIKYSNIKDMKKIKLNKNITKVYGNNYSDTYTNTSLYSPCSYLTILIGVGIGKIFSLNPYYIGMLGRLTNLICYILICALAFKLLPRLKLFFLILMTSPVLMASGSTMSPDAFTNALVFLLIAIILYLRKSKTELKTYQLVLISILSVILANVKIVYFPIVFLLLLIPKESFKNKRTKYIFLGVTIITALVTNFLWLNSTKVITNLVYVKTSKEIANVLHNPFNYILVLIRTFFMYFISLFLNTYGSFEMYHSQLNIPRIISFLGVFLYIISMLIDTNKNDFNRNDKIFISLINILIMILICSAIYTEFTANYVKFDNKVVVGLQGRYFIPSLMLVSLITKGKLKNKHIKDKYIITMSLVLHIFVLITMYKTFI